MVLHRLFQCKATIFILIFISHLSFEVTPASPAHIHSATLNKEREEDGAYPARDRDHISPSGEHRSEFDHEAILGSVKDAEEFDHLPPEEAKRRLRILLEKMDLNNDQLIERNELKAWILRSFKMLSEEESKERFDDADANEDNKVTWEEYKADVFGADEEDEPNQIPRNEDETAMMESDKKLFFAADFNKDGHLDRSEFLKFTHPEDFPEMFPFILQNALEEKDLNKDGEIDFQEFLGDRAKSKDKDWLLTEKDRFDNDHDKNKDGRLKGHEIIDWMVPSNEEIAEEEVEHLFASSDDDHDDVLTFREVLDNHEMFVGSEVTDYGEHLHNIHTFTDEL